MKKTEKEFQKAVKKMMRKYINILLLQKHTFELIKGVDNTDAVMQASCRYPYLDGSIKYSEQAFKDWKKGKDITQYVVHELCHTITDPLYSKADARYSSKNEILDEREHLTDLICNIVLKLTHKKNASKIL